MPVGISCPVSGHLTMTAPIKLSLFRIVLFRRHTAQLCEHHLTQGRLDRRKLSHPLKTLRQHATAISLGMSLTARRRSVRAASRAVVRRGSFSGSCEG